MREGHRPPVAFQVYVIHAQGTELSPTEFDKRQNTFVVQLAQHVADLITIGAREASVGDEALIGPISYEPGAHEGDGRDRPPTPHGTGRFSRKGKGFGPNEPEVSSARHPLRS